MPSYSTLCIDRDPTHPRIALSCDLLVMAEDARIGYMPTRV